MEYSKIQKLLDNKQLKKKNLLKAVDKSAWGFNKMVSEKTMRIDVLEKMSEFFDVPISYWFDESDEINMVKEPEPIYKRRTEELIKTLRGQVEFLQNMIEKDSSKAAV